MWTLVNTSYGIAMGQRPGMGSGPAQEQRSVQASDHRAVDDLVPGHPIGGPWMHAVLVLTQSLCSRLTRRTAVAFGCNARMIVRTWNRDARRICLERGVLP
jgi:hypothetical protein